jgi:antitoxin StbD
MHPIYAEKTIPLAELGQIASQILAQAEGDPVALLQNDRPKAYILSAAHYEHLMELLEDMEDAQTVRERAGGPFVDVNINDL